ncbi:Temptin [Phytophthora citrophthora]|uniref:Temptin n=1 Tax=Phytophthora citrophthora TaxID=4793 RepID=A0AAD9GGC3_9STRA|nr:Temptin [Phytophthora citrophthora]
MKIFLAFTTTALIVASTFDSAMGLAKYLDELPNGSSFSQELGHPNKDSSKYTDFATAFADAGHAWSADFCAKTFPGSSMTNGEAFGDPCCTWTKGDTPDATVTAFTTSPTKATVCESTADSPTETPATTESPTTESPTTAPPATETPATIIPATVAPSTTAPALPAYTNAPSTTEPPVVTDPPITESPTSGGCGVKSDSPHQSYRHFRH